MLAFTNTQMTKQELIDRLQTHFDADEIIKGTYWEDGKGCAIGCAIHSSDHALFETMFGIPKSLAYLQRTIFEGLPDKEAKNFPLEFSKSIREGADLSKVVYKFCAWILIDPQYGVIKYSGDPSLGCRAAISNVADICLRLSIGEVIDIREIGAAWAAAEAAWTVANEAAMAADAGWAADATAWAAEAARAADAAIKAKAGAAAWAAGAAARATKAAAWATIMAAKAVNAEIAAEMQYSRMRDKLLELLKEC